MTESAPHQSDQELIASTLTGSDEAYHQLMVRHARPIRQCLRGIVLDPDLADDLTLQTFQRAYRYLDRFDRHRPIRPWLYKMSVNLALDRLRRAGRLPPGAGRLDQALSSLPPLQRAVLALRTVPQLTYEECGAILGLPPDSIMEHLGAARRELRALLGTPLAPPRAAGAKR